jgi:hypothetical protein
VTTAIVAQTSTAARLTNNVIEHNGTGNMSWAITASSSPMVLRYNAIAFNRRANGISYGLSASGSTVDAQYNWWGSTTGPAVEYAANTGGGSTISASGVTSTNWLGNAFEADHKRGSFPWAAKAGVGVDVATGNLSWSDTDVSIPTIGFPLDVTRTYNNQSGTTARTDFGAGWTWTYGTNLNTAADAYGGVVWEQSDGGKTTQEERGQYLHAGGGIYSRLSTTRARRATRSRTRIDALRLRRERPAHRAVDTDGNAGHRARRQRPRADRHGTYRPAADGDGQHGLRPHHADQEPSGTRSTTSMGLRNARTITRRTQA